MVIDSTARELRLKLVLVGLPGSGKCQILQDWSSEQADGDLLCSHVGDTTVHRAAFRWSNFPRKDWSIRMEAFTTEGEVSHSAVNEMLLADADGVVFVAPVDGDRAPAILESLAGLGEVLIRGERHLSAFPLVLHYHQSERMPEVDANQLDAFLGIPTGIVPHVLTRSDDGSSLGASMALLLQRLLRDAEPFLPQEEVVDLIEAS